jgi:hypothetical protein
VELRKIFTYFLTLVLSLSFLLQTFSRNFVIADYYVNTVKYEKNCENKEKPKLQCHGKCQMMKKLQEEEQKDQQQPQRKTDKNNEVILSTKSFFASYTSMELSPLKVNLFLQHTCGVVLHRSFDIFHPPRLS